MQGDPRVSASSAEDRGPQGQPACSSSNGFAGLGNGVGGLLARGQLVSTSGVSWHPHRKPFSSRAKAEAEMHLEVPSSSANEAAANSMASLRDEPEPRGMLLGLLLDDRGPVTEDMLDRVRDHRWTFAGATDLAMKGRSHCFFIWCLLELQRNVQLEDEGDPLETSWVEACKSFVNVNSQDGQMGDMYHMLTHFISNSLVFYEWDRFLKSTFEDERANQESFLVPHLEQVWGRYCKFRDVLESIFDVLSTRFVWRHRLPKIGDLVNDQMKRRCFSGEHVTKNDVLAQPQASRNETVKQLKVVIGWG